MSIAVFGNCLDIEHETRDVAELINRIARDSNLAVEIGISNIKEPLIREVINRYFSNSSDEVPFNILSHSEDTNAHEAITELNPFNNSEAPNRLPQLLSDLSNINNLKIIQMAIWDLGGINEEDIPMKKGTLAEFITHLQKYYELLPRGSPDGVWTINPGQ